MANRNRMNRNRDYDYDYDYADRGYYGYYPDRGYYGYDNNRGYYTPYYYDRGYYGNPGYDYYYGYSPYYGGYDFDYGSGYYGDNYGQYYGYGPSNYTRSDERIQEDINDRMTWHGDLDATDINVAVNDGVVTLTGSVDSRQDKRLAEDIADSVSGVWDVNNQLSIRSRRSQANSPGIAGSSAPQRAPTG